MLLIVCLLLQDSAVFTDEFDRAPLRDGTVDGWARVEDERYPLYNRVFVEGSAMVLRTLGLAVAVRHRGVEADPRLEYRLAAPVAVTAKSNRASAALRWLDRDGRELRSDEASHVEFPPAGAARVQVELRFGGPDVRAEARFDSVRLTSRPRIEFRGPLLITHRDRAAVAAVAPASDAEMRLELRDADGAAVRSPLTSGPLPPAAYRLVATAGAVSREAWLLVTGPPVFDPPEPGFGVRGGIDAADAAGARHVAVDLPAAAGLLDALSRRPDTSVTGIGRPDARFDVDRWADVEVVRAATVEEALARGLAAPDRRLYFDAAPQVLYAVRTLNDLIAGARPVRAPSWAPTARAFSKGGRTIVAVANADVTPPAGFTLVVDPLLGARPVRGPVKAGARTLFLVSH